MDYQIKYLKKGFSILEVLIVIGIFTVIGSVTTNSYVDYTAYENREVSIGQLVQAVRFAQSNSQNGVGDSNWGVKVLSNQLIVFKGSSYASRDQLFDQVMAFSGGVIAGGLSEIVFEKISGNTVNTGVITITNNLGVKNIEINAKGTIIY